LGLRWGDVDLDRGLVAVSAQLDRRGGLADVKTERGRRTFGLPELAVWGLKRSEQPRRGTAWRRGRAGRIWGWCSRAGTDAPSTGGASTHPFVRAQARAGVRRQRFHDMRHAFATLLLEAGEELAVISKMLGHADYATTVDVYRISRPNGRRSQPPGLTGLLKRRAEAI
jgi:integrase